MPSNRLLKVPCTARRSNQSILREINLEYSLEGLMLKLKLQDFGHLVWTTNSLEKTLILGKIECGRRMGRQRTRWLWHHQLDGHEFVQSPGVGNGQGRLACCSPWVSKESDTTERLNGTELNFESTCSPWIDSNKPITYSRAFYFLDTTKSVPCSPWLFTLLLNAIPVWTFLAEFSYRVWVHMANMLLLILSVHYYMLCVS